MGLHNCLSVMSYLLTFLGNPFHEAMEEDFTLSQMTVTAYTLANFQCWGPFFFHLPLFTLAC